MDIKQKIKRAGKILWEEHLVSAKGGNLSVLSGDRIFITKTGSCLGFLEEKDIIEVPLGGTRDDFPQASSELIVHNMIYQNTSKRAVAHAHPPLAISFSFFKDTISPLDYEGKIFIKSCPIVSAETLSATEEIAVTVAQALKEYNIVCIRSHGVFAAADDIEEAVALISSLEASCRIIKELYVIKSVL